MLKKKKQKNCIKLSGKKINSMMFYFLLNHRLAYNKCIKLLFIISIVRESSR